MAVSTLGVAVGEPGPSAELLSSPLLTRIGQTQKPARAPEEVALKWVMQSGVAVRSKIQIVHCII